MEVSINYQYNKSNKFFSEHQEVTPLFSDLSSDYLFFRVDYGLSKKFTLSVASGYFLDKSKIGKDNADTISSNGVGDLIIFPRYSIYNKTANFKRTAVVLGLGFKIPLGAHNDSTLVYSDEWIGDIYSLNPPMLQTTNGSNDFMFTSFLFREYQKSKLRFFISSLYVKKGFNSLGIKYGDYTSVSFFASKTLFYRWGLTSQIKAEKIGQIQSADNIDLVGFYNISPESTGSKKWFFIPQLSYSQNGITVFATSEIPLYQYLNGTQVGSQHQFTFGVNYRFLTKECEDPITSIN
jgi:hypothetical protein